MVNLLLIIKFGNIFIMFVHPCILFIYQNSNNLIKYNSILLDTYIHIAIYTYCYILFKIKYIYLLYKYLI